MTRKKRAPKGEWVDPDDAPEPTKEWFETAEMLRGDTLIRSARNVRLQHGDYTAKVNYDFDARVYHGEVVNARDVLTFQGRTLADLPKAFADTLADYAAWCRERHKEPQR